MAQAMWKKKISWGRWDKEILRGMGQGNELKKSQVERENETRGKWMKMNEAKKG